MIRPLVLGLNGRLLRNLWKESSSSITGIDSVSSMRGSGVHIKLPHTTSWVEEEVGRGEEITPWLVPSLSVSRDTAFDRERTLSKLRIWGCCMDVRLFLSVLVPALTVICLRCLCPILKCGACKSGVNIKEFIPLGVIRCEAWLPGRFVCGSIMFYATQGLQREKVGGLLVESSNK